MRIHHTRSYLTKVRIILSMILGIITIVFAHNSSAVPSFARQTGMNCNSCHTVFPKLTSFGRLFKLNGYTMTGIKQIDASPGASSPGLQVNEIAPMSAMLQIALTHQKTTDPNTENKSLAFPSALSLYYAGEISSHSGAFVQVTMDDAQSSFSFDMADLRYATTTTIGSMPITYGFTADNMSGMEDLWNTTPAWTYPYLAASPDHGDSPAINSLMGAGAGAYAMLNNHWYGYIGDYFPMSNQKIMNIGTPNAMGNPHANTPYMRLAWQGDLGDTSYLEVGTYELTQKVYGMTLSNNSDEFTDTALDAQYETNMESGSQLNAHFVHIHEAQNIYDMSNAKSSEHMNQTRADVGYIQGGRFQYQFGYFKTEGSSGAHTFDGMNSVPYGGDSKGYVAEVDYLPRENTKISLQYTGYNMLNGDSGSLASDNNSYITNFWFMW